MRKLKETQSLTTDGNEAVLQMERPIRIGLLVERQRAYGRRICEGAASAAVKLGSVSLGMLEWTDLQQPSRLVDYDAFIVRILDDAMAAALRRTGKPVVDIFRNAEYPDFHSVDLDHEAIAHLAFRHFDERGFTSFAYCGYEGVRFSDIRRNAFVAAAAARGRTVEVFMPTPSVTRRFADTVVKSELYEPIPADAKRLTRWLMTLPPATGIFCSHDLRAHHALRCCARAGLAVPGAVALIGCDDDAVICSFATPTITSIDPDGHETGRKAVSLAVEAVARPHLPPRHELVPPKRLIPRGSTEVCVYKPDWLSEALMYIRRHAVEGIGAADVFAAVGRSHTAVARAFRETLGSSVQEQIAKVRLEHAKVLLESTDMKVAEVALRSGFSSTSYFCGAFFAAFGQTPSNCRR